MGLAGPLVPTRTVTVVWSSRARLEDLATEAGHTLDWNRGTPAPGQSSAGPAASRC
jgi:hypothetical protein